ncbi:hypothetical protein RhiirA4_413367 [Rhizophagus irregularis]|uniref:Uncharacterized protein n=1 Tax=Rhizophagus irregularis TaxID=588596 RepID=A0A2I1FSU8_9GLOM|nr:hypothetical protein RhiirA4_413367 [Rhizophagus irregularis]
MGILYPGLAGSSTTESEVLSPGHVFLISSVLDASDTGLSADSETLKMGSPAALLSENVFFIATTTPFESQDFFLDSIIITAKKEQLGEDSLCGSDADHPDEVDDSTKVETICINEH